MKLFMDNGYIDMKRIIDMPYPFIFIVGARGTGKTFGALDTMRRTGAKFLYMRRTQAQTDLINKIDFSPFKAINKEYGSLITAKPINKYSAGFYEGEEIDGTIKATGQPIGYTASLSTISNMRGFDASEIEYIIYDEFIPEYHERPIKAEGEALMNAYETINRNRELTGNAPVKLVCMANSNRLDNPVFIYLNLVNIAYKMQQNKSDIWTDEGRGIAIILVHDSPISKEKADTALYKLTEKGRFSDMAIHNAFEIEDDKLIQRRPLNEYVPVVSVGDLCIWKHKGRHEYYVCFGKPMKKHYKTDHADLTRFTRDYWNLWKFYLDKKIIFSDRMSRALFVDLF